MILGFIGLIVFFLLWAPTLDVNKEKQRRDKERENRGH